MARKKRVKINPYHRARYHVFTKVVQGLWLLIEPEDKKYFINLVNLLAHTFFVKITSCQVMNNHFHLVLEIGIPSHVPIEEIKARFHNLYPDQKFNPEKAREYVVKWGDLSIFMQQLNQRFATYFNRKHKTSGHFWGDRFKSILIVDFDALANCMAYVDLNATRANIVSTPEEYEYGSIWHVLRQKNANNMIDVTGISNLFSDLSLGAVEDEVRTEFSQDLEYLPPAERDGYLKYLAFVRLKQESGFLKPIRSLCRQAILGRRKNIEQICADLKQVANLRYHQASDLPGLNLHLAFTS